MERRIGSLWCALPHGEPPAPLCDTEVSGFERCEARTGRLKQCRFFVLRLLLSPKTAFCATLCERSSLGVKLSSRFVAGMEIDDALRVAEAVNKQGMSVSLDSLGESVTSEAEAHRAAEVYHRLLDAIAERKLNANVSVKLTQLGLLLSPRCGRGDCRQPGAARPLGEQLRAHRHGGLVAHPGDAGHRAAPACQAGTARRGGHGHPVVSLPIAIRRGTVGGRWDSDPACARGLTRNRPKWRFPRRRTWTTITSGWRACCSTAPSIMGWPRTTSG